MSLSQAQEIVEVTADSGVDSGLDNVADMLGAGGREEDEIGDPEFEDRVAGLMPGVSCQLSVVSCRELLPATGLNRESRGGIQDSRTAGRPHASAPYADRGDVFAARRPPTAAFGGTSPTGGAHGEGFFGVGPGA